MVEVIGLEKFKTEVFNFETHKEWVFEKEKPLIVNFFATWCGPCHMFAPILEEVSEEHADQLKVYKVDIDASPEIAALFGVRSVPTTLFLSPGQDPAIASGVLPRDSMKQALRELMNI